MACGCDAVRTVGRVLLLLTLLLVVGVSAVVLTHRWSEWRNLQPVRNAGLDERVLFQALGGRTMRFNAATNHGWFALQGFVVAPLQARTRGLGLSLEITLESASRGVLHRERRYVGLHQVEQAQAYGLVDGRVSQPAWILATEWIDLSQWPLTRAVAVRVVEGDPQVRMVLWRGAIDSRLSDAQTNLRFRRLGGAAREALTEDWITPASLIAPEVKRELVRYRLERIGPLGQPQRDFIARSVLRTPATAAERVYSPRYAAITLSPAMRVSFELDAPRRVQIDARTVSGARMQAGLVSGANAAERMIDARWSGELAAGLYELHSNVAGTVEVRDADSGDLLVPDGLRPRFHVAGPAGALRYPLYAVAGSVPALRLSLRAQASSSTATLAFTDAQGNALESREVIVPWIASEFDRPADALQRPASDALRIDLDPPSGARELRVSSDTSLLVTASTTLPAAPGLAVDPKHRWFTFFPVIDPRSPLSQGVVIVQQPRRRDEYPHTAFAAMSRNTAGTHKRRKAAHHTELRMHPEAVNPERDE